MMKTGKLWMGDCLELMKKIPDGSIGMVLCDLPYGTTACKWDTIIPFKPLWTHYWRVAKKDAAIVLTSAQPFTTALISSQIKHFKYNWIWEKEAGTGFLNAKKRPLVNHEDICVFSRGQNAYNPQMRLGFKPYKTEKGGLTDNYGKDTKEKIITDNDGSRYPLSVISFSRDKNKLHPTQKPVALFEYLIKTYTKEGDVVLDNCAGSGTTAIAAMSLNRKYICIEKDERYFGLAKERIQKREYELGLDLT